MEAKPGPTLVWKNRSALLESELPPQRATLFLGRTSALWSDSSDRGLYKTGDSGENLEQVS